MQAAVINILINLQSKRLGNYDDVKICFPLPLHSTGTDRAFKFLNTSFMFSRAQKSLWTVILLGDAPSSAATFGVVPWSFSPQTGNKDLGFKFKGINHLQMTNLVIIYSTSCIKPLNHFTSFFFFIKCKKWYLVEWSCCSFPYNAVLCFTQWR